MQFYHFSLRTFAQLPMFPFLPRADQSEFCPFAPRGQILFALLRDSNNPGDSIAADAIIHTDSASRAAGQGRKQSHGDAQSRQTGAGICYTLD